MKGMILLKVGAAILAALLIAGVWLAIELFGSPFKVNETTYIYVRPTDSEASIMEQLRTSAQANSLRGWKVARMLSSFKPRTGRYAVVPGESMWNVYRKLQRGRQEPVHLVIPSVRTLERLAGTLAVHLMMDSAAVADSLTDERFAARYGYSPETLPALFIPNTYEVYWDMPLGKFMQRMQRENKAFWNAEDRKAKAEALHMNHEEVVTLASIVDEETAANAEKTRVAGMYLNRLAIGMPLQADPTVKFALYKEAKSLGRTGDEEFALRRILNTHLHIANPYNTYRNTGLPPGPIRIASVAGIDAVLNHENHNYIYMCAKEDFSGTHNFSTTYAEHQANARRYAAALNARGIK